MLVRSLSIVAVTLLVLGSACTTAKKSQAEGYPELELEVEDPDPEHDADVPKFCNPNGLTGTAQQACFKKNEEIYRVFDDEAKTREPWFNFTQDSWVESPELDQKYVVPVVKDDEAVKRLESVAFVALTDAEVEHFTGKKLSFPNLKPYMVRGLVYYRDHGSFTVVKKDQAILVQHDSLGKDMPKETRTAVVVFLDFTPKQVYVDCTLADEL